VEDVERMPLKRLLDSLDDLAEDLRDRKVADLYVEKDGKYELPEIDGLVPKEQFETFRTTNRELNRKFVSVQKDLERFKDIDPDTYARLKDIDPDEYQRLKEEAERRANDPDSGKASALEQRISTMARDLERVTKQLKTYETEMASTTKQRDEAHRQLEHHIIDSAVADIAIKKGVHEDLLWAVKAKARDAIRRHEGNLVVMDGEDLRLSEKHKGSYMDPEEWIESLAPEIPSLFKSSGGGGAQNNGTATSPRTRVIPRGDPLAFGRNLEDIASGKAVVQQ
jgi:hypothetical protein